MALFESNKLFKSFKAYRTWRNFPYFQLLQGILQFASRLRRELSNDSVHLIQTFYQVSRGQIKALGFRRSANSVDVF